MATGYLQTTFMYVVWISNSTGKNYYLLMIHYIFQLKEFLFYDTNSFLAKKIIS